MALTTRGGIMTAIDDYLSRQGDLTAAYKSEYFLTLAHARIHYGSTDPRFPSDPLRVRAMEATADVATTAQAVPLPDGYLAMRRVYLDGSPVRPLNFMPPMDFWAKHVSSSHAQPRVYTVEGDDIVFGPVPDSAYTAKVLYWRAFDLPVMDADTNWLMTHVPAIYLYGSLIEAAVVIQDDEQLAKFGPMFAGAIGGLIAADKRDRFSGAPLQMRNDSGNP
jgi:hypothetical protein